MSVTLRVVRGLLLKAVKAIDAELNVKTSFDECPHTDAAELATMRMGKKIFICNDCGKQFSEELTNEEPQTMGRRRPGDGIPGRTQGGA